MTLTWYAQALPATFTASRAREAGLTPRELYRMRDDGRVNELSRGVFRLGDASESAHLDLLAVAARTPVGVVCLESALALHELIDDIPNWVHIAVPRGTHVPRIEYPPVRVSRFAEATFQLGVEPFEAAPGENVRIYGAARSVVDAMRLRHQVGETLALRALRRYLRVEGASGVSLLLELSRTLGVEGPVCSTVEAILA